MSTRSNNNASGFRSRIIQFPLTRLFLALLVVILSVVVAQLIASLLHFEGETDWAGRVLLAKPTPTPLPFGLAAQALLSAGLTVLFTYGAFYTYVHFVEKRELSELGSTGALKEFSSGMLVGMLLFTAAIAIFIVLGVYHIVGTNDWTIIIIPLTGAVISAFLEEIMFRGILFKIIEESLGTWLAFLISASLFGLLHLANPDATLVASLAIIVNAGILLAAAYVLTRRLWLVIGIHFAWNFTQAGIFGVTDAGILQSDLSGPIWLSGGDYGPEASVVTVVLCLAVGIYFIIRAVRQNRILPPSWRRVTAS